MAVSFTITVFVVDGSSVGMTLLEANDFVTNEDVSDVDGEGSDPRVSDVVVLGSAEAVDSFDVDEGRVV